MPSQLCCRLVDMLQRRVEELNGENKRLRSQLGNLEARFGAWQLVNTLPGPCSRSSHNISALGSCVYVFGGEAGPLNSHFGYGVPVKPDVFVLDLGDLNGNQGAWNKVEVADGTFPPSARLGHGQAIVESAQGSGFLYVFGGRQPKDSNAIYNGTETIASLNDMHKLNLRTGSWEELHCTGDIPSPRSFLQLISAGTERLFLFGGMFDTGNLRHNDLYMFNLRTTHWTRLCDGPMEGRGGAGMCAHGDSIWVVGGFCGHEMSDVWEYSIAGVYWRLRDDLILPVARSIFACDVVVPSSSSDPTIVVFGGELEPANGNDDAGKYSNDLVLLRPTPSDGCSAGTGAGLLVLEATAGAGAAGAWPCARGWTSGCTVQISERRACFAVFGGIREGAPEAGEPVGVRKSDLALFGI